MSNEDQGEAVQENEVVEEVEDNDVTENTDEGEETLVVSIGDDEPDKEEEVSESAPEWVKDLRKTNREQKKRLKEYETKEAQRQSTKDQVEVGERPKQDDYDYEQQDKFAEDLIAWNDRKRKLESNKKAAKDEESAADERYHKRLASYDANKAALKVDDFEEVEDRVKSQFSVQQHAIAIHALDKPELFMLAVGNNQKTLDRLSEIKDPVIFAVEIGKIEAKLKTTKRKSPPPETRLKGTAAIGGSSDTHMEKLEREADKTGDRTKIYAYRRSLKEAS